MERISHLHSETSLDNLSQPDILVERISRLHSETSPGNLNQFDILVEAH